MAKSKPAVRNSSKTKVIHVDEDYTKSVTGGGSSSSKSSSGGSASSKSSGSTKTNSSGQTLYSDGLGDYTTAKPGTDAFKQASGTVGSYSVSGSGSSGHGGKQVTFHKNSGSTSSSGSSGGSGSGSSFSSGASKGGILGGIASSIASGLNKTIQNAVNSQKGGSSGTGTAAYSADRNYSQEAADAASRGDWDAVTKALAARQAKINAQGGNDRGTSNADLLAQLRAQYPGSYDYDPSGWQSGNDYLSSALSYARAGNLDAAYNELAKRGFKMNDTGSSGGGTSLDQAYALIHQAYDQSPARRESYERELQNNAALLAQHPTQFGNVTNPELAYKHYLSQDGKYIIVYDGTGTPVAARPNSSSSAYNRRYTPEEADLLSRYYGGTEDFADISRQLHNLNVVRTGNGRLVDQSGNWASGAGAEPMSAADWQGYSPNIDANRGQSSDALKAILAQINAGRTFDSPVSVPITDPNQRATVYTAGTGDLSGDSGGTFRPSAGGALTSSSLGTAAGYGADSDLTRYLQSSFEENLASQLAGLRSSYERSLADLQAQDDLIAQRIQDQRNQAAGQNDLQRMYMAEMGAANGLNTGASGQMGLALSMAYQNALASLGSTESQALADSGLARNQLAIDYRGDVDAATADSRAQLSSALYNELLRQIEADRAAALAAQEQANWQAQFDYQRQLDAASQEYDLQKLLSAAQQQSAAQAWDLAELMLKNGVVPDEATLAMAGIDPTSARSLASSYQAQLAAKQKTGSSGGSGGSSSGSGSSGKPRLTYSQAVNAIENGQATDAAIQAYDYYMGSGAYQRYYGNQGGGGSAGGSGSGSGNGLSFNLDSFRRSVSDQLSSGNTSRAISYVDSIWGSLTDQQKKDVQTMLSGYGVRYNP